MCGNKRNRIAPTPSQAVTMVLKPPQIMRIPSKGISFHFFMRVSSFITQPQDQVAYMKNICPALSSPDACARWLAESECKAYNVQAQCSHDWWIAEMKAKKPSCKTLEGLRYWTPYTNEKHFGWSNAANVQAPPAACEASPSWESTPAPSKCYSDEEIAQHPQGRLRGALESVLKFKHPDIC